MLAVAQLMKVTSLISRDGKEKLIGDSCRITKDPR